MCTRTREALQQFLQHEPGSHDDFTAFQRMTQGVHLRQRRFLVAPKRMRPDARIDEQGHRRDRSTL
jgi:hypothetical protein